MKAVITLSANGAERKLEAQSGELLSSVLSRYGAHIDMPCGGKGICKSCQVSVDGESRLACRTSVDGDMRVEFIHSDGLSNIASGDKTEAPPVNPMYKQYGLAVDIGTTTVCASLLDAAGRVYTATRKNPQTHLGADVISRIEKSLSGQADELADCILGALAEMTGELCASGGVSPDLIDAAVITGNTAMLYLLARQNPEALSHAPFQADRLFGEYIGGEGLGLPISPTARVYLPRCVAAFVGGDITTAIIASGMCQGAQTAMLVDIGTNGELALWHDGKLVCCSTAAGPAFEGAGITHGVYGIPGAIDRVWQENGKIHCSTIGGIPAVGICGSGVVDALAVMLELGVIDETGAFADSSGFLELENGIGVTASDVRKIQLAKGSVRAGLETLLDVCAVKRSELETLYIAGGFGSFINLKNAAAIGLIPEGLQGRIRVIGNAAHTGAAMLLRDKSLVEASEALAGQARAVPLDSNPVFTDNYMTYMMFEQ